MRNLTFAGRALLAGVWISTLLSVPAFAVNWPPVSTGELEMKTPGVDKSAHAEVNLWEVWVNDSLQGSYLNSEQKNYIRIKIFDQRGVEMMSKVDIEYLKGRNVSDVAARVTKPNGEVIELSRDAVFDRVIVKARGVEVRARSFALPGLEPGCVIEYGWLVNSGETVSNYIELDLQREIPVHVVRYHLHPLQSHYFPFEMRYATYQAEGKQFVPERAGYYVASWSDLPAFTEEPDMPADFDVRSWLLVYYEKDEKVNAQKYWREQGKTLHGNVKRELKINGDVKEAAARVTEGATTHDAKLAKLYEFCQTKIRNIHGARNGITPEEREKFKPNMNSADTLRQGMGSGWDIDVLFTALADALGFDARIAKVSDREYASFRPQTAIGWAMRGYLVAVQQGEKWRFLDPASTNIPMGMLRWQEEGSYALISDPKEGILIATPMTLPAKTVRTRIAKLTLGEDGSLTGSVWIERKGHFAVEDRARYVDQSSEQLVEHLTTQLKNHFGDAEITQVRHVELPGGEGTMESFRVKIPYYAQRTGKRLFVRPSFFEGGGQARFTASERKYPIQFSYPWSEVDRVDYVIPDGYELDHAELPGTMNFGATGHFSSHGSYTAAEHRLTYVRELVFGSNGNIYIEKENYPALKSIFSSIHEADERTLTLKQTPSTKSQ